MVEWSEFGQLVPLLASRDVSLMVGGTLCGGCVKWCAAWRWGLACGWGRQGDTSVDSDGWLDGCVCSVLVLGYGMGFWVES